MISIQSQCLFYLRDPQRDPLRDAFNPNWLPSTPAGIDALATHIAEFSLAGIRALANPGERAPG